jgi:hypothetical protein
MLTHRHRALFEASYSALLLRSDPREQSRPPQPPATGASVADKSKGDRDFNSVAELD